MTRQGKAPQSADVRREAVQFLTALLHAGRRRRLATARAGLPSLADLGDEGAADTFHVISGY